MSVPIDSSNRHTRLALAIVTIFAAVWTAGTMLAPWLVTNDWLIGSWMRLVYRPGCHQLANRCLDFGFGPLAVCARCFGLYLGGTAGLLWTTLRNRKGRPHPIWLLVVTVPTVIDWALGVVGLASTGNGLRFALAVPLGWVAALFLGDALIEIVRGNSKATQQQSSQDSVG
jgi:uncharacterized membrane protein